MSSTSFFQGPVFEAVRTRMSRSKVTDAAPTHEELVHLLSVMNAVADHSNMRPWRIIELRGDDRTKARIPKATRAPLVLAVVVSPQKSKKVPYWEQETVASGVAHNLGLLLAEAGWGTMWRTGDSTRSKSVRKAHKLNDGEQLLGWIYVGGVPKGSKTVKPRKPLDMKRHLGTL